MISLIGSPLHPTWKRVEDDFVMGACSRRLFGYVSRGSDGAWSAFDEEARLVATGNDLRVVSHALWTHHVTAHDDHCAPAGEDPWWRRPIRAARARRFTPTR